MKHRVWHGGAAAIALLMAAAPIPSSAQTAPEPAAAESAEPQMLKGLGDFISGVMAQQIASHEVAGATLAIVHDGELIFSKGYGFADIEAGERVDPADTLFRPGSVSKLFTWTALMQQVEEGRVDLDADVNDYIDFEIPPFEGQPIRVRDLMSHSPGMSDVSGISAETVSDLTPYGDWIKIHIPDRVWAPGTETAYSNYGVALAGYIVERASGEPFASYAEDHIFAPLGMDSTTFREPLPARFEDRMATGYKMEDGRLAAQPFELFSNIMPAGSASSTAHDMARFMLALLNDGRLGEAQILEPGSVDMLFSDSIRNAPDLPGMAHGFYVIRETGPRMIGHGGNTGDFHSNLVLAPAADFGLFVSVTGGEKSSDARTDLTGAILGRVFPQDPAPRRARPEGEEPPVGTYRGNRRDYSKPAKEEYDIKVAAAGDDAIRITSQDQTTYWERIGPSIYEKVTGARQGGPYDRVQFYQGAEGLTLSYSHEPYMTYRRITN